MTLSNFLTLVCDHYTEDGKYYQRVDDNSVNKTYFKVPRIHCNDGFSISLQIFCGSYCESENGYRQYGKCWKMVEWGFPSDYSDDEFDKNDDVGSIDIDTISDILSVNHSGIDWIKTVKGCSEIKEKVLSHLLKI